MQLTQILVVACFY